MGAAAYNRGSRCITRGLGLPVIGEHSAKPEPRPEGWGTAARLRAEDRARRIVAGADRYGLPRPSVEVLAEAVRESARVGRDTAADAAIAALANQP